MPKPTDQLRAEAVTEYLRGTSTQEDFCAAFQARTGHPLSPRTLRSWIARFGASGGVDIRALLDDALDQMRLLAARLQAALDLLDGEAAAHVPDLHVGASHEDLPSAASSAAPVEVAAIVALPWVAVADQPLGIEERAKAEEAVPTKFTWD